MKKLSILCAFVFVFGLMAGQAFAVSYCKDYLEPGNPGGYGTGLKTFDEDVILEESDTILVDIYLNDVDDMGGYFDGLVTSGFQIYYSDSVEVLSVNVYDGFPVPAPWDQQATSLTHTPGSITLAVANLSNVYGDSGGDIIIAQLEVHCLRFGPDQMVVMPIPGFDTNVSGLTGQIYDPLIIPNVFTFNQFRCCVADQDCDDGDYCNGVETCVDATGLPGDGLCAPNTVCQTGAEPCPDDGAYCNGDETCNETSDSCDHSGDPCLAGDGLYCNGTESCDEGADNCNNHTGNPCPDDAEYCNGTEVCHESSDDCGAINIPCGDDGTYCNGDESCNEGSDICDHSGDPCPADDGVYCNGPESCLEAADICISPDPCAPDDTLYCNGVEGCDEGTDACTIDNPTPCDDANDCTDDTCIEAIDACANDCNATSASDPCCLIAPCDDPSVAICAAAGYIDVGDQWANCGDVGVKIPICLINLDDEIGAVQIDLCEDPDCLICVGCEMTERTTIFDCMVNELENGCCALIIFSKNPGGVINPGECDIVIIDYTYKDDPECCTTCIVIVPENIVVVDQYGYDVEILTDETQGIGNGMVCPFECGDVEPANTGWMCGDGDVDIFDILEEVDFIIHVNEPTDCQAARADVPTGTPPYCIDPDGNISVADLMVIIDMALGRQDCCSYYYGGVIY